MLKMSEVRKVVGARDIARWLSIPPTTVYSWDIVPKWREEAVRKALKKHKIEIKGE